MPTRSTVQIHVAAETFAEQVRHQFDHRIGGEGLSLFNALMRLQFEAGEGGHDEEVAMEVIHGFFEQGDLEIFVRVGLEQMSAGHGLIKVRSGLCDNGRVSIVDHRLGAAGVIGVHGMTQLMRERAHTADVICVAHQNKGMCVLRNAGRECALAFARVG